MACFFLPDLNAVRRILIIRLSSIGDVTHAIPISAALKESFPHLELTWIVEEMSADIVTGNPYLNEVIVIPRSRWKRGRLRSPKVWWEYLCFLGRLRARRFDVALDLQGYAKTALLSLASGARYRIGWRRLKDGANLVSHAVAPRSASVHRVDWFLDVAREFGVEIDHVRFPLEIPESSRAIAAKLLAEVGIAAGERYAVLNPAVGDDTRRWGARRYAALARGIAERFGMASVLVGSAKDSAICDQVASEAKSGDGRFSDIPTAVNIAGKTGLKELAAVLDRCSVHVCGDTGSAHIASALGKPVISLYGPTDPAHAGPWAQTSNVISHRELCCDRCTVRRCFFTSPSQERSAISSCGEIPGGVSGDIGSDPLIARCLAAITPDEVLRHLEQVLDGRDD